MKVFLFKAATDETDKPDKFETVLKSVNFTPEIIPVLAFDFCNLESLLQKLQSPSVYQGIIFSSPRCVQSVKISVQKSSGIDGWEAQLRSVWANHKWIFCVGPATADVARDVFDNSSKIVTSEDGNAESLAAKILEILATSTAPELQLLYPCGNLKRDTLQNILHQRNLKTDPIVVYETVENPSLKRILSETAADMGSSCSTSPFVFFSPSGLNFSLKYVTHSVLVDKGRALIALGPTTKDALLNVEGVDPAYVFQCPSPNSEGLLEVLKSLEINAFK